MDGVVGPETDPVRAWIGRFGDDEERRWDDLVKLLKTRFDRDITLEAILFLVGVQVHGRGFEPKIHRDRKQDLIMEGTFAAFESIGFYERVGMESTGAWIWERLVAHPPDLTVEEQEVLLKMAVLEYFAQAEVIPGANSPPSS
jgi:hypothetical protein